MTSIRYALALLAISIGLLHAEKDHNNEFYLFFYDQNNNPIDMTSEDINVTFGSNQSVTDGQNPNNHSPSWDYGNDNNSLIVSWDVGRHKSSSVTDSLLNAITGNNTSNGFMPPFFNAGNNNNKQANRPKDLNFYFSFDITGIPLAGGAATVDIRQIYVAQTGDDSLVKLFDAIKDFAASIYDASEVVAELVEEDPDYKEIAESSYNSVDDFSNGWSEAKAAFENFWMLSQYFDNTENSDTLPGVVDASADHPPIIITGSYTYNGNEDNPVPVIVKDHNGNDHYVRIVLQVPTGAAGSTATANNSPASAFRDLDPIGPNFFFDHALGIFEKFSDTSWIHSVNYGWTYPNGSYDVDLWLYSERDGWLYINKTMPGLLYMQRQNLWLFYNPLLAMHQPIAQP